jgi:hypothetical protein
LDVAVATGVRSDGRIHPLLAREAVMAAWSQMQQPLAETEWRGRTMLLEAGRENGAYTSPDVVAALRAQLTDALEHVVLDVTHFIPSDYPDLLAENVRRFLAGVEPQ